MAGATRLDGTEVYAAGESFKTGSDSKQARLEAYVDWLLTPDGDRAPRTKREFAEQWGISSQTLRNDLREPFVQRELAARARAIARVDRLPAILENLYRMATGGTDLGEGGSGAATPANAQVSAARVLLEWMSKTEPIRESDVNVKDLSDDELMQAVFRGLQILADHGVR